jgi:adenine deaminase
MGEFSVRLRQRITDTETALRRAMYAKDVYAVQVEQGELDSLLRIAAEHGVDVARPTAA